MMDKSNPPGTKLDSGTTPNGLEGFWIFPSFKDRFSVAPCQTLVSRFATFSSPYPSTAAGRHEPLWGRLQGRLCELVCAEALQSAIE